MSDMLWAPTTHVRIAYVEDHEGKIVAATHAFAADEAAGMRLDVLSFDEAFERTTGTRGYWSDNFDVVLLDLGEYRPHDMEYASTGFELARHIVDQGGPPIGIVTFSPDSDDVLAQCRQLGIKNGVFGTLPRDTQAWCTLVRNTIGGVDLVGADNNKRRKDPKFELRPRATQDGFRKDFERELSNIVTDMVNIASNSLATGATSEQRLAVDDAARRQYDTPEFRWAVIFCPSESFPWSPRMENYPPLARATQSLRRVTERHYFNPKASQVRLNITREVVRVLWRRPPSFMKDDSPGTDWPLPEELARRVTEGQARDLL